MENNRLIVVLGMHRSGTSAITRGLVALGVSLGDNLLPPQSDNAKGFWEDMDFYDLNIRMLTSLGRDWHQLAPIEKRQVDHLTSSGFLDEASALLRGKTKDVAVFGFKDPRTAILMPFWREVFSSCQIDVRYIVLIRHPLSVAKSIYVRNGFDLEVGYLLWLGHVLASVSYTNNDRKVIVDYDRLLDAPDVEFSRVADQLELKVDPVELEQYKAEFLDHKLRNSNYNLTDLSEDNNCPPLVAEVYSELLQWTSDGVNLAGKAIQKKINLWSVEYERNKACLIFLDRLISDHAATAVDFENRIQGQQGELVAEQQRNQEISQVLAQREEQLLSLASDLEEKAKALQSSEQALNDEKQRNQEISQVLAQREEQLQSLESYLKEMVESTSWKITKPFRIIVHFLLRR